MSLPADHRFPHLFPLKALYAQMEAFAQSEEWEELVWRAGNENPWFTPDFIALAWEGMCRLLLPSALENWVGHYYPEGIPTSHFGKRISLVMAGNLPFVGFSDVLAVLASGMQLELKLSSQDQVIPKKVLGMLMEIEPSLVERIHFVEQIKPTGGVIATGSNNTSRYFEYYFSKYPSIIRKNRNGVAVLTGKESDAEYELLGKDIFQFFGLGCRSVSHLFLPKGFDITKVFPLFERQSHLARHHRYANNYDYQKSLLLINSVPHLDTGFLLVREEEAIASAISVLHISYYESLDSLRAQLIVQSDLLQCVCVSDPKSWDAALRPIAFGQAQAPGLFDYPDGVDVMAWLKER